MGTETAGCSPRATPLRSSTWRMASRCPSKMSCPSRRSPQPTGRRGPCGRPPAQSRRTSETLGGNPPIAARAGPPAPRTPDLRQVHRRGNAQPPPLSRLDLELAGGDGRECPHVTVSPPTSGGVIGLRHVPWHRSNLQPLVAPAKWRRRIRRSQAPVRRCGPPGCVPARASALGGITRRFGTSFTVTRPPASECSTVRKPADRSGSIPLDRLPLVVPAGLPMEGVSRASR